MQIKTVEGELTHDELTHPTIPRFHLSVCLALFVRCFDHILFDHPCERG